MPNDHDEVAPIGVTCAAPLLLTAQMVSSELSVGLRTFWRLVSGGLFPSADIKLNARIVRWRRETVLEWIAQNTVKHD